MARGSRYGRESQERAWQTAEVDALRRLATAGVRVPKPHDFHEGVLLMELVTDAEGNPAPRLNDVEFSAGEAREFHRALMGEVVRMLCAGVIHGDLSEFNILAGPEGPVVIDLPQAVDAAGNNHAAAMFERDVNNLRDFFGRFEPAILDTDYAGEIWATYLAGTLTPDTALTGEFTPEEKAVDLEGVVREIGDAERDEMARRLRMEQAA